MNIERQCSPILFLCYRTSATSRNLAQLCSPWLWMVLLFLVMGIVTQNPWLLTGAAIFLVPVSLFLREILSLSKESKTRES